MRVFLPHILVDYDSSYVREDCVFPLRINLVKSVGTEL